MNQNDRVRYTRLRLLGSTGIVASLAMLALAGCTGTVTSIQTSAASPDTRDTLDFSGPFASDYAEAWVGSESDFVRLVIEDEKISEQEWAAVERRMAACFSSKGATFEGYTRDGGYEAQGNSLSVDRLSEVMGECERFTGEAWLGFLWFWPQKNPHNLPIEEIVSECLIRNGIVAPDYTPEDFLRDNPTLSFPYLRSGEGERGALECNADPRVNL